MPGGPINGVPWSAMAGLLPGGGAIASAATRETADPDNPAYYTGIIIPTVLQMAADALNYWTSMTCLYDPHWAPDPDKTTLPICMFHVADITPVYSVETSKKRIVLYEPQGDSNLTAAQLNDRFRENAIRSIIDNSVKQPTTYTVEAIVPFQPAGRYFAEGIKTITDMVSGFSDLLGGNDFTDLWEGVFSSVFAYLSTVRRAIDLAEKMPDINGYSFINMNSLEAMADSCRLLCMKMWTGYQYKYVQITGMTPKKKGTEDDVFRVSMSLQEKPILSIARPRDKKVYTDQRHWVIKEINAARELLLSVPFMSMTQVGG